MVNPVIRAPVDPPLMLVIFRLVQIKASVAVVTFRLVEIQGNVAVIIVL
jgi:hypothetical protein